MKHSLVNFLAVLVLLTSCKPNDPGVQGSELEQPGYPSTVWKDTTWGFAFEALDSAFVHLIDTTAAIEILASGFQWAEGPVWIPQAQMLLLSDVPSNVVYSWRAGNAYDGSSTKGQISGVDTFFHPSGYFGPPLKGETGANGLILDQNGQLLLAQHGERQVARYTQALHATAHNFREASQKQHFESIVTKYQGKRFHSPNDLYQAKDGIIFFTDPPYGLDGSLGESAREIPFMGVYALAPGGEAQLVTAEMTRPNGILLSPDQQSLIIANSDPQANYWMRCQRSGTGLDSSAWNCSKWIDLTDRVGPAKPGLADGMAMLPSGDFLATGPGGVILFSTEGRELGTIYTGRATANVCTGGPDGKDIFMSANEFLLKARLR